jgi:hypothetical protein
MKHFTIHNKDGEILRSGQCPEADLHLQVMSDEEYLIEEPSNPGEDSVHLTEKIIVKGGRPPEPVDMSYAAARASAYLPVTSQLDMLWHAMDENIMPKIEPWYSYHQAVKESYPKDNSVVPGSVVIYKAEGM